MIEIIALVIATRGGLYNEFKKTWIKMAEHSKNIGLSVKVFFLYSDLTIKQSCVLRNNHDLFCKTQDGQYNGGVLNKIVIGMDYVRENHNFDYVIQSNLSSMIIPKRLYKYLETQPRNSFFGGVVWYKNPPRIFSNIACMILSKDVVEYVGDNRRRLINRQNQAPDVLLSYVILEKYTISYLMDYGLYATNNSMENEQFPNIIHKKHNPLNINSPNMFNWEEFKKNESLFWLRVRNKYDRSLDITIHKMLIDHFFTQ
jgi:hypothetical protein